jgi:hypothetical protein
MTTMLFLAGQVAPRRLFVLLSCIALSLTALSVYGCYTAHVPSGGAFHENALYHLFNLDGERPVPTLFSCMLILINAVLLALIASVVIARRQRFALFWLTLAAIFVYLAIDEGSKIHEEALDFLIPLLGIHFLHFWVIPASVIMLGFVALYWPFVRALPPATRTLFIVSGIVYLSGALGLEAIGGVYAEAHGKANFPYLLLANVEETAEMMGMILFSYALLRHLHDIADIRAP